MRTLNLEINIINYKQNMNMDGKKIAIDTVNDII